MNLPHVLRATVPSPAPPSHLLRRTLRLKSHSSWEGGAQPHTQTLVPCEHRPSSPEASATALPSGHLPPTRPPRPQPPGPQPLSPTLILPLLPDSPRDSRHPGVSLCEHGWGHLQDLPARLLTLWAPRPGIESAGDFPGG